MDFSAHIAAEEAYTRELAADPAWREYIEDKAEKMARWQPAMYGRLPQIVSDTPIDTVPTTN